MYYSFITKSIINAIDTYEDLVRWQASMDDATYIAVRDGCEKLAADGYIADDLKITHGSISRGPQTVMLTTIILRGSKETKVAGKVEVMGGSLGQLITAMHDVSARRNPTVDQLSREQESL